MAATRSTRAKGSEKSSHSAYTSKDQKPELFTSVLEFANLPALPEKLSRGESLELRAALGFIKDARERWPHGFMSADKLRWKSDEPRRAQRRLIQILTDLVERGVTRDLGDYLAKHVTPLHITARAGLTEVAPTDHPKDRVYVPRPGTVPRYEWWTTETIHPTTLEQWCAVALAQIVALDITLGRCALRSCGRFFAAWKLRGKKRVHYCQTSHASQDRVAASRHEMTAERWRNRK